MKKKSEGGISDNLGDVAFVGLGRMGLNMSLRLLSHSDLKVHVWNRSSKPVNLAKKAGAVSSKDLKSLVKALPGRRVVWLMLPSGQVTEDKFQELLKLLSKNDIIIDGGNANFHDSMRRAEEASKKKIKFLDVGVSGGVVAAKRGYAMMAGGPKEAYDFCLPLFKSLCLPEGFTLVSPTAGTGHYVKMVHNAVEYGMMQSIGEGFNLLKDGCFKDLNLKNIAHTWNHGTIISSFLMEMTENALKNNPSSLKNLEPWVDDSGEGKWAAIEAIEQGVPFTANDYALQARRISRGKSDYSLKMLAAIRNEFGGHKVKSKKKSGKS